VEGPGRASGAISEVFPRIDVDNPWGPACLAVRPDVR
jgi:hypothetical protein